MCNRPRSSFPARRNGAGGGNFRNPKRGVPRVFRKFPTALPCIMEPRRKNDTRKKGVSGAFALFEAQHVRGDASLTPRGKCESMHPICRRIYFSPLSLRRISASARMPRRKSQAVFLRCPVLLTASRERRHVVRHGGTVMRYRMWRHFRDVTCHGRPKRISGVSVWYWPIPF